MHTLHFWQICTHQMDTMIACSEERERVTLLVYAAFVVILAGST